jgi:type I restriction enzyme S subunit
MGNQVLEEKILKIDKSKWKPTKLGTLAEDISVRVDKPGNSEYDRFVGLDNFVSGDIKIKSWASTKNLTSSAKAFKAGDILFARRNAYLRRASLVDFDGCCSGDAFVIRENVDKVVPGFLAFLMNTNSLWDYANSNAAGTMSKRVKWRDLAEYEFLLPPKAEQARLAELLWTMDEVIEKDSKLLISNYQLYLSMRSNLLIGKESIETSAPISYKKVKKFGLIPKDWNVSQLSDLTTKIQDGNYGGSYPTDEEFLPEGIPFLTSTIISEDRIDINKLKFISHEKHNLLKKAHIKDGDVLLTNRGANVGRCAVNIPSLDGANIGPQVTLIRCSTNKLNNRYLYHFMRSKYFQKQIEIANAGSAMNFISLTATSAFYIICPPLDAQFKIAEILDFAYLNMDTINTKIENDKTLQKSLINQIF